MANGGYRPGSGRKKGQATVEREKVKDYIAQRIAQDIEPMVDTLISRVITKGDTFAFRELADRGFGRPHQSSDVELKGKPVIILEPGLAKKYGIDQTAESDS